MSIDHLGMTAANRGALLRLVNSGVHVKATGFGRLHFDVSATLAQIHAANPASLMFGTDLPTTRAPTPFQPSDIDLLVNALPDDGRSAA